MDSTIKFFGAKENREVWNFRDSRGEFFWTVDGRFCVRMAPCKGFVMTATCTQITPITAGCLEADWGNDPGGHRPAFVTSFFFGEQR